MIFLTVGSLLTFDRLVSAVDDLVGQRALKIDIFAQIGKGGYRPRHFQAVEVLDKKKFDEVFLRAEAIISHAGMGTITMALAYNRPILVMPRLRKYREAVNDHQLTTAKRFEQAGHILATYTLKDLPDKIKLLNSFKPVSRESAPEKVAARIGTFLHLFQ